MTRSIPTLLSLAGLGLALLASTGAPAQEGPGFDAAMADAARRKSPVLVDFRAPWCYSCYYMAKNVLTGAEWTAMQKRTVFVDLDADGPEGAAKKKEWNINMLPAYLVLDEQGRELGRILGEQTRQDFYRTLDSILARRATLEDLQAKAAAGGKKGLVAVHETLDVFRARHDADGGLKWYQGLPGPVRTAYDADAGVQRGLARLRLAQADAAGDAPGCAAAAPAVFPAAHSGPPLHGGASAATPACDSVYELEALLACTEGKLPDADRRALLAPQRAWVSALVEKQVFGPGAHCADERSAVLGLADLDEALGDPAASAAIKQRAAEALARRIGNRLGADRNLADNLRVYYDAGKDWEHYDALMPKLADAWPDDYVYPFRFGKSLLARGRAADALPWLERAAPRAYGQNRLQVAEQQAAALTALGRADDAKHVIADALKANGPWFPEAAAKLKAML